MNSILYFLRSTEQKIVTDMLHYAYRLDEADLTLSKLPALSIYNDFYGFTRKDLGLYALVDNEIAGAIWTRKLNHEHNSNAFIDEDTPVLSIAVLPKFRRNSIGSAMMEQFLQEAAALYQQISVSVVKDSYAVKFYEKFGFIKVENSDKKSKVDDSDVFTMLKILEKKEVERPSDGYDPRRWMD